MVLVFGKLCLKKSVHEAVTAFSLSSSHNKKVEIIIFYKGVFKASFCIICLGHSCRDRILTCKLCTGNLFPYIAKCSLHSDGRYIAGLAYKEGETEDEGGYVSWVFDTKYDAASGVESAPAADATKVVARFTADGKRLKTDAKARGFNMMLMKNGKTIKSFNK